MKTASHYTFTGPGRISISLGAPRGAPAGYKIFKALAPTREILKADLEQPAYRYRYRTEVLDKLDPRATWDELHRLAGDAEPVIQCFEKPPFTYSNFCHRRMVADWFGEHLGETVDEVTAETPEQKKQHAENRLKALALANGSTLSRFAMPVRAAVEAVRSEIDAFWTRVCSTLGIQRDWTWMGLPDRVRDAMSVDQVDEWRELQARYKGVDA